MNAVLTLATRLIEDQKLRDAKREAEAGELSTFVSLCADSLSVLSQSAPNVMQTSVSRLLSPDARYD
jgi:hypothetical protein